MLARIVLASLCVGLVSATVICQDGALCGEQSTCCLTEGGYGCCSGLSAVCCSDQLHCCPAGYHCSNAAHSCVKDGLPWYRLPWLKHVPAKEPVPTLFEFFSPEFDSNGVLERPSEVGVVYCDNTYFCNDYSVCCVTRSGNWSCCPHTNGRCCRDGIHCCPFGSYCDRTSMKCLRGDQHTAATPQLPAFRSDDYQLSLPELGSRTIQRRPSDDHVEKCDEDYFCRYGQTCCLTPVGTWTCCKYSRGHCCRDGYHCCASGYVCDSSSYNCLNMTGDLATNAARQLPALRYEDYKEPVSTLFEFSPPGFDSNGVLERPSEVGVVHCDNTYFCNDYSVCCVTRSGNWSCCPHANGWCCRDGIHCCPFGSYCDRTSMKCLRGDQHTAATPQFPAFRSDDYQLSLPELGSRTIQRRPSDDHVEKCDEDYFCRYGQTCCLTPVGTWTCCKYSRGHCCRDGYHCCASGYVCDSSSYNCLNMTGDLATNAARQLPALRYEDYKDPCCLSEAGCCQVGFHCDRDLRACVGDFAGPVPSATLIQAPVDGSVALSGVMHCRGRFYCPTGNSCCQSLTGEWGCCPYRQGQCCLDGKHCCGYKWTCDVTSKSCFRGDTSIASASMREIQQL